MKGKRGIIFKYFQVKKLFKREKEEERGDEVGKVQRDLFHPYSSIFFAEDYCSENMKPYYFSRIMTGEVL